MTVEQPKCAECEGSGVSATRRPGYLMPCPRCGGSGYEPMVPLVEVVEWLRDAPIGYRPQDLADEAEQRFGGGEL